jgi:hypothetical protein
MGSSLRLPVGGCSAGHSGLDSVVPPSDQQVRDANHPSRLSADAGLGLTARPGAALVNAVGR